MIVMDKLILNLEKVEYAYICIYATGFQNYAI